PSGLDDHDGPHRSLERGTLVSESTPGPNGPPASHKTRPSITRNAAGHAGSATPPTGHQRVAPGWSSHQGMPADCACASNAPFGSIWSPGNCAAPPTVPGSAGNATTSHVRPPS